MTKLDTITLRKKNKTVNLLNKTVRIKEDKELIKEFYENKCSRYLELSFKTPTSFKRDGKYVIYPDLSLIYGSLMRKFSAASEEFNMYDEDTLEELVTQSEIVRYRLQTIPFPLEKTNITGFIGNICIHIKGPETMARYVRMLAKFGEFSGVGIKTGMGMGAMKYIRRNEDD
jgi:CRISPR-associated endoribonuclease Cas6